MYQNQSYSKLERGSPFQDGSIIGIIYSELRENSNGYSNKCQK